MRFATMMIDALTSVIPAMIGRSERTIESIASEPMPGRLKIVSVMIAPPSRAGEVQAGGGHDRGQAGAQRVLDDDRSLGQALGARRPHVVVAQNLEHLVARQPHVERRVQHREDDPRQDHRLEELHGVFNGRNERRER